MKAEQLTDLFNQLHVSETVDVDPDDGIAIKKWGEGFERFERLLDVIELIVRNYGALGHRRRGRSDDRAGGRAGRAQLDRGFCEFTAVPARHGQSIR